MARKTTTKVAKKAPKKAAKKAPAKKPKVERLTLGEWLERMKIGEGANPTFRGGVPLPHDTNFPAFLKGYQKGSVDRMVGSTRLQQDEHERAAIGETVGPVRDGNGKPLPADEALVELGRAYMQRINEQGVVITRAIKKALGPNFQVADDTRIVFDERTGVATFNPVIKVRVGF